MQINCKDLIKQLRWPLRCLRYAFSEERKEKKYDFEGWKKPGPRSLVCILKFCLTGKENDWQISFSPTPVAVPYWAGGDDLGVRSLQLRKAGFGGAAQGCVQQHTHSPDGRIYTKALIVWFIKAGSILTKIEPRAQLKAPFPPLPLPCALRNPHAGVAGMRKRGKIGVWWQRTTAPALALSLGDISVGDW